MPMAIYLSFEAHAKLHWLCPLYLVIAAVDYAGVLQRLENRLGPT